MATLACEIWLMIDADGDYVVGVDQDEVTDAYKKRFPSTGIGVELSTIKLVLPNVPLPAPREISVTLPESPVLPRAATVRELDIK